MFSLFYRVVGRREDPNMDTDLPAFGATDRVIEFAGGDEDSRTGRTAVADTAHHAVGRVTQFFVLAA